MKFLKRDSLQFLRCGVLGIGLGLLAGACEAVQIATDIRLDLSFGESFLLGMSASVMAGLFGFGIGLGVGLPIQLIGRKWYPHRVYTLAMAATAFFLSGFFLWHAAGILMGDERLPAAIAMAVCPLGVAGVVYFNAGYWARRESLGGAPKLGWLPVSLLLAMGVNVGAAAMMSGVAGDDVRALTGEPNVLLITIDTLRRDHVSAYGEGRAETPRMDALAEEGILFMNAITPTPETAPAHASMMTALHPIRHKVTDNSKRLEEGFLTLAELLREEEYYATGAFLSSFAVNARTGLNQGFQIYEDDFFPGIRGFGSVLLTQYTQQALMILGDPHDFAWLLERRGDVTNQLASDWIRARGEKPWFAWVHYFEPHAPYEGPNATVDHRTFLSDRDPTYTEAEADELRRLYAYEAGLADTQVGVLLDLLAELEIDDRTMVIVTADHGEQLGEHDIFFHHHGLYDESIQVPLIIRAPGQGGIKYKRIEQQVRLMDLTPTVLKWLKFDRELDYSEGVPLLDYATAVRERSLPSTLFGRKTASLSEGTLFGMRAPAELDGEQVHIKYIYDKAANVEELYNLAADPDETVDISETQPSVMAPLREHTQKEMDGAKDLASDVSQADIEALKVLGYME